MSAAPTYHSAGEASATGNKWTLPAVLVGAVLLIALLIWLFRGTPELETGYGRRMGPNHRASVNGTIVFSEMFRFSGRTTTSVNQLSPKLRKYQTIVWFPNDFEAPKEEQRKFLEQWMSEGYGRTLIYVGRDYDAATAYWSEVLKDAPKEQVDEIKHKRSEAKSKFAEERARMPKEEYARWYVLRESKARKATTLAGPWAADIDAKQADIAVSSELDKPTKKDRPKDNKDELPEYEPLLTSEKETLIAKVTDDNRWNQGQIFVVANGSMLLNYPLINHENRKIAGKLIDECSPDAQVAFLESGPGGPSIEKKAADKQEREWPFPLNAIIFHLVMLSLVFCLGRSAIFGRARELPVEPASDFGKHIAALGKLMQRTKDQAYAYARLQQYRQHGKRDSGKSHKK